MATKKPKKKKEPLTTETIQPWLIFKLRRMSMWWGQKTIAKNKRRLTKQVGTLKDGSPKMGVFYSCEFCEGHFKPTEVHMDHINPVVNPETGFKDWNEFIERLFCNADGFQVLCVECHAKKSASENSIRKVNRKPRKKKAA